MKAGTRLGVAGALLVALINIPACSAGPEDALEVVIKVHQTTPRLAKATIMVEYGEAGAHPLASGDAPACTYLLPHIDGGFTDDGQGRLTLRAVSARGFRGPAEIAACRMAPDFAETAAATVSRKLEVSIVKAFDSAGDEIKLRIAQGESSQRGQAGRRKDRGAAAEVKSTSVAGVAGRPQGAKDSPAGSSASASEREAAARSLPGAAGAAAMDSAHSPAAAGPQDSAAEKAPATDRTAKKAAPRDSPTQVPPSQNLQADSPPPAAEQEDGRQDDAPVFAADDKDYELTLSVTSQSGDLGALQFIVSYSGQGRFLGDHKGPDCIALTDALFAGNVSGASLTAGFISLSGMPTPGDYLRCGFRSSDTVGRGDFAVTVKDAADPLLVPVIPVPSVTVSSVVAR